MSATTTAPRLTVKQSDGYLTVRQVADCLQTKEERVRFAIHRGELSAITISNDVMGRPTYRIHPLDLQAWVDSRRTGKPKPQARRAARRQVEETTDFYATG